jgi:hypothetical protein
MDNQKGYRRLAGWFAKSLRPRVKDSRCKRRVCAGCADYDWLTQRCRMLGSTKPEASCRFWEPAT